MADGKIKTIGQEFQLVVSVGFPVADEAVVGSASSSRRDSVKLV